MNRPLFSGIFCVIAEVLLPAFAVAQDSYWEDDFYEEGDVYSSGGGSKGSIFGESDFSYGYFDMGYFRNDFKNDQVDNAGGIGGALSIPLIDSLFVKAALGYSSPNDVLGNDLDYLAWDLGGGIGLPLGRGFDIVIDAGLAYRKLEGGVVGDLIKGYGYYVTPGIRWLPLDVLELNVAGRFSNVDGDSDFGVDLKAFLHLTPNVSLWGGAIFSEEINQYGVGLRLSF